MSLCSDGKSPTLSASFEARPAAVRATLTKIRQTFAGMSGRQQALDSVELVLAEVLNNIVEHAYADRSGKIMLEICAGKAAFEIRVRDIGRAMPNNPLPRGDAPRLSVGRTTLPEVGFGWSLIPRLARDLTYRRDGDTNALAFRVPYGASETKPSMG